MNLTVALPNKGALSDGAASIFKTAGYRLRMDARDLSFTDSASGVEFVYLRPRDIATYVASGEIDLGVTGRDLLMDSGADATEVLALNFGKSQFRFAGPVESVTAGVLSESKLIGKRIATSYPRIVGNYLSTNSISAQIVHLDGAVEGAIKLGVADLIADVVSTGNTLRQASLAVFGRSLLDSEAILIARHDRDRKDLARVLRRIEGVVIARQYVLVDYDVTEANLAAACEITPGLESPTISPLHKPGWVAVRAMVKESDVHDVMDRLWEVGARGILVTDLHLSRL